MAGEGSGFQVGKSTVISISSVVSIIFLIGTVFFWLDGKFDDIHTEIHHLDRMSEDRFSGDDMRTWVLNLRIANPDLLVPPVQQRVIHSHDNE